LGTEVVVTEGGAKMTMDRGCNALPPTASASCTVKENVPDADGVPVMAPGEVSSVKPGGSPGLASDQVYGGVPPEPATTEE
jgi:hypothetical protein